eukprot:184850_1
MSQKAELIQSLIKSFSVDPKTEKEVYQTLQKYSTQWIQSHHVVENMKGVIEKFAIQSQTNKHLALQSCFEHYQQTADHNDENYAHIIHLLLETSDSALQNNNGKIFRNLQTIIKKIESEKIDERKQNEHQLALVTNELNEISEQLSEWEHEWEECNDELSEWSDHSNIMNVDSDDDDDDVINDMKKDTPGGDTNVLQMKSNECKENKNISTLTNLINESKDNETILYMPQVTKFESLVSALMGVDTIYFKWRTDHFVCVGSGHLMIELCSLLEYANYYRNCKDIIDHISKNRKEIPLCIGAFFNIISEFLQIYRENLNWFISSKYYAT